MMISEKRAMQMALALARRGAGMVTPNPMVGAVVLKKGAVVGRGFHRAYGGPHAEVEALSDAGANAQGATLVVTLEPCAHSGKTPPCVEAILKAGVSRVVIAASDDNPDVSGGGAEQLRAAGVEVSLGCCEAQARELNAAWYHWCRHKRPFVLLKLACSLDGKVAAADGNSKWISSAVSRAQVQRIRREVGAVMVGAETVRIDNPRLTNRTGRGAQPLRVVLDSKLSCDQMAEVFSDSGVLVFTTSGAADDRVKGLVDKGIEVVVAGDGERVAFDVVLSSLAERGVQSLMCEGGATLATALLENGLVDRLLLYQAPILLGASGKSFYLSSLDRMTDTTSLSLLHTQRVASDVRTIYSLRRSN